MLILIEQWDCEKNVSGSWRWGPSWHLGMANGSQIDGRKGDLDHIIEGLKYILRITKHHQGLKEESDTMGPMLGGCD